MNRNTFVITMVIVVITMTVAILMLSACSSANISRTTDYGTPKLVVSNGGSCVIQLGISVGRVEDVTEGDGWYFVDLRTGKLVQMGGDVFITDATEIQKSIYLKASTDVEAITALLEQIQADGTIVRQSASCNPSTPTPE